MPEQTYSIGFGKNDFFYSTEPNKLKNLLQTIPFDTDKLIDWCDSKRDDTSTTSVTNIDSIIFNSEISKIILDPKNRDDFINNYMPGNISINNNFNSVALGLTASGKSGSANSVPIGGNIVITTTDTLIPKMYGDISSGSLNYSTLNGEWNQDISINTIIQKNNMYQYIPPAGPITYSDGSTQQVTVSANTRNPRCKFVNNCREKHEHSTSCRTVTKTDASGQSFCQCVCDVKIVNDDTPHTHCVPINNIEDTATNGLDITWVNKYIAHTTLTSLLNDITMNLKANFLNNSAATTIDGKLVANYTKLTDLNKTDLEIRETLYDYYAEIIKNRDLQANLMDNKTFNNTAKLISHDATQNYRKQYLELFNVTTGIFLASSYIYISMKSNS
jgi:phage FluMu protein Com